jgi:hypothetical protein
MEGDHLEELHVGGSVILTLILLMWRIGWAPNNASRLKMGYNSAFKGLKWIFKTWDGETWAGLLWPRTETGNWRLWML